MLKVHPLCEMFPDMEGQEYEDFRESLKMNGQQFPCIVYKGLLIDGKNRQRALTENHQGVEYEDWQPVSKDPERIEEELRHFIMACNLQGRRHLSQSQKAILIAKLAKKDDAVLHLTRVKRAELSEKSGVSGSSIQHAATVLAKSTPEVAEAVTDGKLAVSAAAKIAKLPKKKQSAALKAKLTKAKPIATPFDEALSQVDWVLKTAVPKVQEFAMQVERQLGRGRGDFSSARISSSMKTVFHQFESIRGVLANAQIRALKEQKK